MEDAPKSALIDQLFGQGDGGGTTVIVPDHVGHTCLFDGLNHFQSLRSIHGQRFLAQNHFAGPGSGEGNVFVHVVGAGDVDQVDIFAGDQLAPICFGGLVTPFAGKGFELGLVTAADRFQYWFVLQVEKIVDLAKRVGVRAAHEAITDESDIEFLHDIGCCDWQSNGAGRKSSLARFGCSRLG